MGLLDIGLLGIVDIQYLLNSLLRIEQFFIRLNLNGLFYILLGLFEIFKGAGQITGDCLGSSVHDLRTGLPTGFLSLIQNLKSKSVVVGLDVSRRHTEVNGQKHGVSHIMVSRVLHVFTIMELNVLVIEHCQELFVFGLELWVNWAISR